jgi:hypothetical protein
MLLLNSYGIPELVRSDHKRTAVFVITPFEGSRG